MKKLKPITGTGRPPKPLYFATADIEAHHWINFLCIGYYDGCNRVYRYFEKLSEFLDWVFQYSYDEEIENVFMHFGGKYDFNFILGEIIDNDKYYPAEMIPRGSGLLCLSVGERKITKWINKEKKIPFMLHFRDSSALLSFALRKLAQTFKVPTQKGFADFIFFKEIFSDINYAPELFKQPKRYEVFYGKKRIKKWSDKYDPKKITYTDKETNDKHRIYCKADLCDYLKDDCVALWEVLDKFYSWDLIQKAGKCLTTASQAVKIWQTFIKDEIFSLPKQVDEFVRKGYFGGRTEIFRPIFDSTYNTKTNRYKFKAKTLKMIESQKKLKKLYYYDVNSLYPTVMRDNDYPIKFDGWVYDYDPKLLAFWECEVTVPKMFCPPLGTKYKIGNTYKLVFPTGTFSGIWTGQELEYAKSLGCTVNKVTIGASFVNGGRIFETFINELYAIRMKAKKNKDTVNDMNAKLIMNSCYGRLGLVLDREKIVIDEGQLGIKPQFEIKVKNKKNVRFGTEDVRLKDSFSNVAISAFVTANSRILMHRDVYTKAGASHLYYTDTDSAFCTKELPTGDKLGALKLEYDCKSACFLLPKTYITNNAKVTMKGFDKKKIQHFTMVDFVLALRGDLSRLKIHQGAKFATLKTAMRRGAMLDMAFSPEHDKEADQRKIEQLQAEFAIASHEENKVVMRKLRPRIKRLEKKLEKDDYKLSERGIKSQYDKRVIINEGFSTRAIHIEEGRSKAPP